MAPKRLSNEAQGSSLDDGESSSHLELVERDESGSSSILDLMIDPDAVDFEPLMTNNISGLAVNYHTSDHPEHQSLRRMYSNVGSETVRRIPESGDSSRSMMWGRLASEYVLHALHRLGISMARIRSFLMRSGSANISLSPREASSSEEESDRCRYLAVFMMTFVALVVLSHFVDAPVSLSPSGSVITKVHKVTHAPDGTVIPPDVRKAYKDNDEPQGIMDTPVFWHIPRSAGTTMKLIMSMCMGRVLACEQGAGHQLDEQLEILKKPFGNFANVDTSTPLGIQRAADLGLIPSRMVDVVLTPHMRQAAKLFDSNHKGRLFTIFRDPIERMVSLYYFLRMPDQEAALGLNIKEMTLERFASDYSENWMVRKLTGQMSGPIGEGNLNVAKEIIRRKFLVGLLEDKTETLRRIEAYFGWKLPSRVSMTCKNNMFYFEPQSKNPHPPVKEDSREYQLLLNRNRYDIELYEYAKFLFAEQKSLVGLGGSK